MSIFIIFLLSKNNKGITNILYPKNKLLNYYYQFMKQQEYAETLSFIGEMIHDSSDAKKAFKAAWGAFKGFLLGTGIKMISVLIFIWIFAYSIFAGK